MNATAAALPTEPLTVATALEGMANTVLLIGEWLVKQQQQLAIQQSLLEEKQRLLEAQQKQIEELTDSLDKLKNRSSQNSSVPPCADQLKKQARQKQAQQGQKAGTEV